MTSGTDSGNSSASSGGKFVPPTTSDLDTILDAYEFIDILGQGGMGAVYKARQKSLDREVAIKILPADLGSDDDDGDSFRFAERFQREARAMAKLSHPNIISVYDFGQAGDGQLYIVMEFIEGTDLHVLIQGGELTTDHVLGWTSQICDALQYAHGKGIIHRDIKPANVMISREGQVKIADFGLAKLTGAGELEGGLTMTNMAMGTPDYIAPEALEESITVDHRADLYAVGVMLYEMLTGKVPRGSWKAPSNKVPGLDSRYDALVERAMDSDREGRFQNASDIASTLYEISTTPAAPLTAGGKSLITGDAAAAAASGGRVVTGTVKRDLSSLSSTEAGTDENEALAVGESPKNKTGLLIGVAAAVIALAVVATVAFRGGDKKQSGEVAAAGPEATTNAVEPTAPKPEPAPAPTEPIPNDPEEPPKAMATDTAAATEIAAATLPNPTAESPETKSPTSVSASPSTPAPNEPTAAPTPPATSPVVTTPTSTVSPAGPILMEIDLLPILSQRRDLIPAANPRSTPWTLGNDGTFSTPTEEGATHIAAPVSLAAAQDCEIEFWWTGGGSGGEEHIALDVPVGDGKSVRVKFDIAGDKVSINSKRLSLLGPSVPGATGRQVKLRRIGTDTLVLQLDNQKPITHSIDPADDLSKDLPAHPLFPNEQLPILTATGGRYKIIDWKVRVYRGDLVALEDPLLKDDQRLAQLKKGFQSAVQRDVEAKYTDGLTALNKSYGGALQRARRTAQQSGALDDVVAFRKEQQRLDKGTELPAKDPANTPATLSNLLQTYRTSIAKLEAERRAATLPLYQKYLAALTTYEGELTRSDNIEKALALRDYRRHIVARRDEINAVETAIAEATPSPEETVPETTAMKPTVAPSPPPEGVASDSVESRKELARWLDQINARFVYNKDGQHFDRGGDSEEALPTGKFDISEIHISTVPEGTTAADFGRLGAAVKTLRMLSIHAPDVSELPALRSMEQLSDLTIADCSELTLKLFADVGACAPLRRLSFLGQGTQPTLPDNAVQQLAKTLALEYLRFENVIAPSGQLAAAAKIKTLREFRLDGNPQRDSIDFEWLDAFANHPSLETFNYFDGNDPACDLSRISVFESVPTLNQLGLSKNAGYDNRTLIGAGKISSLKSLQIDCDGSVDDEALAHLAALPNLEYLSLIHLKASGAAFSEFRSAKTLRELALEGGSLIDTAGVQAIGTTFENLEILKLYGGIYDVESLSSLKGQSRLRQLNLTPHRALPPEGFAFLPELKNLLDLSLEMPQLEPELMAHVGAMRKLQTLTLTRGKPNAAVLSPLANLRQLENLSLLDFEKPGFSEDWIPELKKIRSLKRVWLRSLTIPGSSPAAESLRAALSGIQVDI